MVKEFNMRRRFAAALLISMTASVCLSACGGSESADIVSPAVKTDNEPIAGEVTADASPIPGEETDQYEPDSLPSDLDFGGREITVLGWNHYEDTPEFYAAELTGDVVNDAFYYRNLSVEERLNIKFSFLEGDARGDGIVKQVNSSVMSGSGEYDITAAHSHRACLMASKGLDLDLLKQNYIDFDKPWWSQKLRSTASVGNTLCYATGDICISSIARSQGIFFNQDYIKNFGLGDPYDFVLDGSWTLDKMISMTPGIYSDLDANSKKNEADQFGFCADAVQLQAVFYISGLTAVDHNDDGSLTISSEIAGEKSVALLEKMGEFMKNNENAVVIKTTDDDSIFSQGRALFYAFPLGLISSGQFRGAEFDIGFVPWPKYEEADADYTINISNAYSMWQIPIDAKNADESAAVMEALASAGYRTTSPALFETAYKVKYNNIDAMRQSQVYDILRQDVSFDISRIFNSVLPFSANQFGDMIAGNRQKWVSTVEKVSSKFQAALDDLVETFRNNSEQ